MYEGPICCITLSDGTRLYGPQTLPDKIYTRKYDQIVIVASNERSTEEILSFEHMHGRLVSTDILRPRSMQRWTLINIS